MEVEWRWRCTWKGCEFGLQSREALGAPPDPLVSAGMLVRVTVLSVLGGGKTGHQSFR